MTETTIKDFWTPLISESENFGLIINYSGEIIGQYNRKEFTDSAIKDKYEDEMGEAEIVTVSYKGKKRHAVVSSTAEIEDGQVVTAPESKWI